MKDEDRKINDSKNNLRKLAYKITYNQYLRY